MPEDKPKKFIEFANSLSSNIEFTYDFSDRYVNFLDITISFDRNKLVTSVF